MNNGKNILVDGYKKMGWLDLIFSPNKESEEHKQTASRLELEQDFLNRVQYKDVDFFHLNGLECWAKVVKIYDADTIHCVFFINGKAFKFKVRLAMVDTAEKKSEDPAERAWAMKGIKRLEELIGGKLIFLRCHRWDKYGRLLGTLFHSEEDAAPESGAKSLNQKLIDEGLAYEYHGRRRDDFRDWAPWAAWLDYPDYRPSSKRKPVDQIGDEEVYDSVDSEADFQKEQNVGVKEKEVLA